MTEPPRILARRTIQMSPWVDCVARDVQFSSGELPETYHSLLQADYVAIVALTPDKRIPLVRQYRPAVEDFCLELPAGLVEEGEDPAATCRRELLEETGYETKSLHFLGTTRPDTGRLSNRSYSFFVTTGTRTRHHNAESGVSLELVTPQELRHLITTGQFVSQLHIGTLLLAQLHSFLRLHD